MEYSKKCKQCGKLFYKKVNVSKANWHNALYCSRTCLNHSNRSITSRTKKCVLCKTKFSIGPKGSSRDWNNRKYCSVTCTNLCRKPNQGSFKKNHTLSKEANNPSWKGDKAGYGAIHDWVRRHKGTPNTCEHCGKTGLSGRRIHWANIDKKYNRKLEDFIRLCVSCHNRYDERIKNITKT